LHVAPYTPAASAHGKRDTAFGTKLQVALKLAGKARTSGIAFQAVVANNGHCDNNELEMALRERGVPYVLAKRSSTTGGRAPGDGASSFRKATHNVPQKIPARPSSDTSAMVMSMSGGSLS
jgi:hypothetical protein